MKCALCGKKIEKTPTKRQTMHDECSEKFEPSAKKGEKEKVEKEADTVDE